MITPPPDDVVEVLSLIDIGAFPVPDRLQDAATYAIVNGCVDLETLSLSDAGRRMLTILGGNPQVHDADCRCRTDQEETR